MPITRNEYEQRKQRLEEQLRAGIELLQAAHRAQLRALDMVWMVTSNEDVDIKALGLVEPPPDLPTQPAPPESSAALPARPARRPYRQMEDDLFAALPRCPEVFDRNDVCRALGYQPDRTSLFRALQDQVMDGTLRIESRGGGKTPTRYRRI